MDKIFNKPFAVNGARVTIPENGTENDRVSFDKGFTQPYEVEAPSVDNPNGQGFNILRPEINEALYQLFNACNFLAENIDKWTNLTTENLNDIIQAGRYNQKISNNATASRNYPVQFAGFLLVFLTGNTALTQIYKPFNSDEFFIRRDNIGSGANWSSWDRLALKSEFDNAIAQLQNIDTNLNNNKEDKTKINFEIMPTNTNWDGVTEQGLYYKPYAVQTSVPSYDRAWVYVFTDGADCIQVFNTIGASGGIYKRQKRAGAWSDWDSITLKSFTEATYRKIADSYTKSEVYTKAEINNRVLAKVGFEYNNITNASFVIPNNSALKTCNIQIMFRIRQQNNNTITFNFKNGNSVVASRVFNRSSTSGQDYDVNDYISGVASFNITSALLGKTITPSISVTNTGSSFLLNEIDLLIIYGS